MLRPFLSPRRCALHSFCGACGEGNAYCDAVWKYYNAHNSTGDGHNQGLNVFSTIMKVSGGSGGGGGGDLNAATEYINTYSALLPADLDMSRRLTGGFAEALRAQSLHST